MSSSDDQSAPYAREPCACIERSRDPVILRFAPSSGKSGQLGKHASYMYEPYDGRPFKIVQPTTEMVAEFAHERLETT